MILFILGILTGLLVAILILILHQKYQSPLRHFIEQPLGEQGKNFLGQEAYFIGLSEDEELSARQLQAEIKSEKVS